MWPPDPYEDMDFDQAQEYLYGPDWRSKRQQHQQGASNNGKTASTDADSEAFSSGAE